MNPPPPPPPTCILLLLHASSSSFGEHVKCFTGMLVWHSQLVYPPPPLFCLKVHVTELKLTLQNLSQRRTHVSSSSYDIHVSSSSYDIHVSSSSYDVTEFVTEEDFEMQI
jgi:hypothetical protein